MLKLKGGNVHSHTGVTNHWTTNHWIGLDWTPKICFTLRGMQLKSNHIRCHGEFGTPDLWHPGPRAKYPREIGTPNQNLLREIGTPLCTPWGIWHSVTVHLNVCQRIKARHSLTSSDLIRRCQSWKVHFKKLTMHY